MARIPFTLRIDAEERAALENLSKIEGRPVNQLLNEAIKSFLIRRGPESAALKRTSLDFEPTGKAIPDSSVPLPHSWNPKRPWTIR